MFRYSRSTAPAWILGGSLLTTFNCGANPAPDATEFFSPHAVHEGTPKPEPGSPSLFQGAAKATQIPEARPTLSAKPTPQVQPAAYQGKGQAPASTPNDGGSTIQQQLDELYRKDGREAPQMNLQQMPLITPDPSGPVPPSGSVIQRPQAPPGSNIVSPKRTGFFSRFNPFRHRSSPAAPQPPQRSTGYTQQQSQPLPNQAAQQAGQMNRQFNNQANQFNNRINQVNGQVNQFNGQVNQQVNQQANQQANQFRNQAQQAGRQVQQLNDQFSPQTGITIQPGQPSPNLPPAAPPATVNQELTLPALPGDELNSAAKKAGATPTNFGPNAPKIQRSEPDLLKDVFNDPEPSVQPEAAAKTPKENFDDMPFEESVSSELPLPEPTPSPSSEVSEPSKSLDSGSEATPEIPEEQIPLPSEEAPISEPASETPPSAAKSLPEDLPAAPKSLPEESPPAAGEASAQKPLNETKLEEKMRMIAERGELRGLKGFCPVALRDERELKNALPEFHSVHKGRTYYFHSADAKATFDESPMQYAPVASGLDVVLRKSKVLKEGSLDYALWYKDRLYLFTSQKTLEQFEAAPRSFAAND